MHDGTMGSKIHESRHAGQVARGEANFIRNEDGSWSGGSLYGVNDEISAFKAQYAYSGKLTYEQYVVVQDAAHLLLIMQKGGQILARRKIENMNQINRKMVNGMAEGPIGSQDHIYPMQFVKPKDWDSN
jgi:hypothetical protein